MKMVEELPESKASVLRQRHHILLETAIFNSHINCQVL